MSVLARRLDTYRERLQVLPGVTGLAQIHLPPDTSIDSVVSKLDYDLAYIRRASFWLDIRLLIATLFGMFGIRGAIRCRLLGLNGYVRKARCESHGAHLTPLTPKALARAHEDRKSAPAYADGVAQDGG
jgi:hypothetical protein